MPKTKKSSSTDSDSGPDDIKKPSPPKKNKEDPAKSSASQDKPNTWTLEKLRRVSISEFRGRRSVDIREFYEKNGEILPGKKGIALTPTQWEKLLEIAKEVTTALKEN